MRKKMLFVSLLACLLWQACTTTKSAVYPEPIIGQATFDHWIHKPLHPSSGQAVEFLSAVEDTTGIRKIELHIFEYELFIDENGNPSKRRKKFSQWGLVHTWSYTEPTTKVKLGYLFEQGFSDFSNVEYIFKVYNSLGKITERMALFDAGKPLLGDEKILLYATSTKPLKSSINLCFLPDTDYNQDWQGFLRDVESLIYEGYHTNNKIRDNKGLWQFYYTQQELDGKAIAEDYYNVDLYPSFLKNAYIQGIDAFGLLHQLPYGDGSYLKRSLRFLAHNLFTSETYNHGTAIHETAHAIFNLSDEYDHCVCFENPKGANVFKSLSKCQAFNKAHGFPISDCSGIRHVNGKEWYMSEANVYFETKEICEQYNQDNNYEEGSCQRFIDAESVHWYRSLDGLCIMQDDGDHLVRDFKRTCSSVIDDYYRKMHLNTGDYFATQEEIRHNIYGYEPVVIMELNTEGAQISFEQKDIINGVPSKNHTDAKAFQVNFLNENGEQRYSVGLSHPSENHAHEEDEETHSSETTYRFAVPYEKGMQTLEYIYQGQKQQMPIKKEEKK